VLCWEFGVLFGTRPGLAVSATPPCLLFRFGLWLGLLALVTDCGTTNGVIGRHLVISWAPFCRLREKRLGYLYAGG